MCAQLRTMGKLKASRPSTHLLYMDVATLQHAQASRQATFERGGMTI